MMVLLLLISIASLALSVAAYNQSKPEPFTVQNQQSNANNDLKVMQTQLDTTCDNIFQILHQLDTKIDNLTSLLLRNTDMELQLNCGPGMWNPVAYLNMSDPSQQCPSVWREYRVCRQRICGRPENSNKGCITNRYLIYAQYSQVCGRVIGYGVRTPDGFRLSNADFDDINITSGAQHTHVWSYVTDQSALALLTVDPLHSLSVTIIIVNLVPKQIVHYGMACSVMITSAMDQG